MDHWGYYNGPNSSNGSLFPAHTVLGHAIPGADRTPHWPCTSANMLTSVTYKGGGKKEFEYEPNRLTSGEIIGGGPYQRDSGICLRDGSRFRHPVRISRRRSIRYGYLLYVGRYGKSLFGQYVHISYQQHEFQCAVRSERIADRLSAGQRDSSGRLLHALPVLVFRSVFGFLTGDIHALRCRHDARTSELFVTHLPSPNLLCMATGAVAGTKPVFGRRDPAGLLQPPERSGEHHVSRNQWSAHGLPADGRSQRSAESVQRTEQNRIGHRQKLRSVIPTHSTLTVPKRLPLPSANNPYLHGSLSRPKSFRSAEPEGVIIAP